MPNKIKDNWLYVLWCITLHLGLVQDLLRDLQIPSNAMRARCCFLQTAQKCKVRLLLLLKPWADQAVCSEVQWQNLEVLEHKREELGLWRVPEGNFPCGHLFVLLFFIPRGFLLVQNLSYCQIFVSFESLRIQAQEAAAAAHHRWHKVFSEGAGMKSRTAALFEDFRAALRNSEWIKM